MKTSVFYDNVRDFQDMNIVNQGIAETLMNRDSAILFPVLNNGVTVWWHSRCVRLARM